MLFEGSKKCELSVKTPVGQTERVSLENIEMQGSVWGPIKCSVSVDKIGEQCIEKDKHTKRVLRCHDLWYHTANWMWIQISSY